MVCSASPVRLRSARGRFRGSRPLTVRRSPRLPARSPPTRRGGAAARCYCPMSARSNQGPNWARAPLRVGLDCVTDDLCLVDELGEEAARPLLSNPNSDPASDED